MGRKRRIIITNNRQTLQFAYVVICSRNPKGAKMDFSRIFDYEKGLAANNDREWFHKNHAEYEQAKKDFTGFVDFLRFKICEEAPDLAPSIMYSEPKEWLYRVARDMRFHKNGPPYNPAFRAYISPDKKSWMPIGYYIHLFPGSSLFGTGIWCDSTEKMNGVRDYIIENFEEFEELMKSCPIPITGSRLKAMPKGYSPDEPASEYLKFKDWELILEIPDADFTTFDETIDLLGRYVHLMEPMRKFLLRAAQATMSKDNEFEW